jgi:hypothetical protein
MKFDLIVEDPSEEVLGTWDPQIFYAQYPKEQTFGDHQKISLCLLLENNSY